MKKLSTVGLIAVAFASTSAWAQLPPIITTSQPYQSLTGATVLGYSLGQDEGALPITLPFSFPYFGTNYTQVFPSINGFVTFGTGCTSGSSCYSNQSFPSTSTPNAVIAGVWDDYEIGPTSQVRYVTGASEVTIEWFQIIPYFSSGPEVTFSIKLTAGGGIFIHHGPMLSTSASDFNFVTGFENQGGTLGANVLTCGNVCTPADYVPNRLFTIGEPNGPDLSVTSVTIANFVTAGDGNLTFDVSASLRNFGRTDAPNFLWKAFLSRDRLLDLSPTDGGADIEVATGGPHSLPGVDGGVTADGGQAIVAVSASAATTTAPATGEYYVLVQVDSTDVVMEASEANNVGSTATAFVQGIDLVATSISGVASTGGGNTDNFAFSFFNRGTTAAGTVGYRILLSTDQVLDPGDYTVSNGTYVVSGGATITETALPVVIPANVPNGQFHYLLQVNPSGAVVEANYMNNVAASAAKVDVRRADLLAEQVNFLDTVTGLETTGARFGEAAQMKVRFRNTGGANANNFRVAMVLSSDSSLSLLSDTYVCDQVVTQVAPGTTSTEVTLSCNLPLTNAANVAFATGQYFLFGILDSTGAVFESNKANNSLMLGPIRITAPGADLTVTSVTAPASAGVGEVIPVVRSIRNIGNVDAPAVAYRFYASANDIITTDDVLLRIVDNGTERDEGMVTLARNTGDTATELVRIPGTMPAGTYYVGCIVDPTSTVATDLDVTNNSVASRSMVIAPSSLRVVNTALPDAVIGRPYAFRLSAVGEQGASNWSIDRAQSDAPWLTVGSTDGLLSGTPTGAGGAEVVGVTVVLVNNNRQAAVRLALRILPTTSGVEVTTTSLPAVTNSTTAQYLYVLGAAGGVRPYTWRLAGGTLPTGLALGTDGTLFGAPRNASNGAIPLTVEVRDAVGGRATRQLALRLIAPGAITFRTVSIPDALIGQEYLQDIAVANQDGSMLAKPLVWRVSGAVPGGLSVTPQAELITVSGRATQAGTFSFTIAVEDNNGRSDNLEFTMTVHPPRYRVQGTLPEVLRPGAAVSIGLTVSPSGNVTYRVANGLLPPGLTLDTAGLISGTVPAEGSEGLFSFVVEVSDPAGMTGVTPLSLRVEREAKTLGCSSTSTPWSPLAVLAIAAVALNRRRRRPSTLAGAGVSAAGLGLTVALALVPMAARAQYQVIGPTPISYQPLVNGAVTTAAASLSVPFPMPFFDSQITSVAMSQYGYLAVGGAPASYSTNQNVPHSSTTSSIPKVYIAPWWDVLTTPQSSTNGYRYQVTGVAPNRVMAFEWNAVGANATTSRIAFQVLLYETTGRIRFAYSTALPGTVSASVGIQKDTAVGVPGLACASSASCTSTAYPAGQAIDFFLPPDLEVVSLSAPQTGYAGVAFPQTATIRNRGGRDSTGVVVRFFLSTDATLDQMTDTMIGSSPAINVDAQGTGQAVINAPLPAVLTQTSYFLFAVVDPDRTIVEQSELNNVSAPSVVTIGAPTADLVVAGFTAPTAAMPGATLQVSRSFQNLGNAASLAAKYTYFLSDNASVSIADRSLSVGNLAALNPQQVDMAMDSVTIPPELAPGAYWLGVCVNFDGATSTFGGNEITIVNNCYTQAAAVAVTTGTVTISTAALPTATRYAPFGLRLQATGGTGTYVWELSGGALPPGLTLSTAGDLVGSPSTAGTFTFDAKVTSGTVTDTRGLSLQVMPGGLPLVIVDQSLTAAEFGRVYAASMVAVGGAPPYVWRALDPAELPPGVAVATDGLLEGRPLMAGDFSFGIEVKDSAGASVSKELSLRVVTPTSLSIATSSVETALVGRDYLQPLVAVGGTPPYAWTLLRFQELPENITDAPGPVLDRQMNTDPFPPDFGIGIDDRDTADYLSGTPRKAGLYAITLKVVDGASTEDTASVLLRVSYRDGLAITTLSLPDAFVNQPYQVRLSHNGGTDAQATISFTVPCIQQAVRPGEFACAAGEPLQKLPLGLELKPDGTILGTALADTGTYTFLVKVTDGLGRQDVRALALRLRPDFSLERTSCNSTGLDPSLLALALAGFALRRRRR
ncbi:MAG: putative Ig domain-containing protein [Archangium sp.]|nr:putative Ig domain-containing protein [Archangium sp.]